MKSVCRVRYIDTWDTLRQTEAQVRRDEILLKYWEEFGQLEDQEYFLAEQREWAGVLAMEGTCL